MCVHARARECMCVHPRAHARVHVIAYRPSNLESVSQTQLCSDNDNCCHTNTETEVANQTTDLIQTWHTDTKPTSPSIDPT